MVRRRLTGDGDRVRRTALAASLLTRDRPRTAWDRARATPAFAVGQAALRHAAAGAVAELRALSPEDGVAWLRARGGWSALLRRAWEDAVPETATVTGADGTVLLTIRAALTPEDLAVVRQDAQKSLSLHTE